MFSTPFTYLNQKAAAAAGLLLDTYSGAVLATSVRKLRTAYSGSCMRIRRSNDNAETDIGFSSDYLDTAAISSFVGSNSAYITIWYDQSGNGYHIRQTSAGAQPRIVNAGTLETISSKACVNLLSGGWMVSDMTAANFPVSNDYSFFMVNIPGASYSIDFYLGNYNVSSPSFHWVGMDQTTDTNIRFPAYDGTETTLYQTRTASTRILAAGFKNSSVPYSFYVNGNTVVTGTPVRNPNIASTQQLFINRNCSNLADTQPSKWQEFIAFNNVDQTANQSAIRSNINTYYSIY